MNNKISKKQLRDFGYLIGFGLPLIFGWLIPSIRDHTFRLWTIWVSIPTLMIGIISPRILQKPYQAWMQIGYLLGCVNNRIVLGIVFLLVLMPISFVMRAFGYDPLRVKKSNLPSYKENKKGTKVDLTRVF